MDLRQTHCCHAKAANERQTEIKLSRTIQRRNDMLICYKTKGASNVLASIDFAG